MKEKQPATPPNGPEKSPTQGHYQGLLSAALKSGVEPAADGRKISRGTGVHIISPGFSLVRRDAVVRELETLSRPPKGERFDAFVIRHIHESLLTQSAGGWLASCSVTRDRRYGIDLAVA